jgi:hypothetical protein
MPCSTVAHAQFCKYAGEGIARSRTLHRPFLKMRFALYVFILRLHPSAPHHFGFTSLPYGTSRLTFYSFLYSRHVCGCHAVQYHVLSFVDLQVKAFEGTAHFASLSWQCALHFTFLYFYFIRQPHFRLVLYLSLTVHHACPLHFSQRSKIHYCSRSQHTSHARIHFLSYISLCQVWLSIFDCVGIYLQHVFRCVVSAACMPFSFVLFCFSSVY